MGDIDTIKGQVLISDYAEAHLDRRGTKYVCPACGSGTGRHKTPAFSLNPRSQSFTCFACGQRGDVLDLAGLVHHTTDKREQIDHVATWAGLVLDASTGKPYPTVTQKQSPKATESRLTPVKLQCGYEDGREQHRAYIANSRANIDHPDAVAYLAQRGYSLEDARAVGLGYDHETRRIVIPWPGADYYHIDRAINPNNSAKYTKPNSEAVGPQPLYNPDALNHDVVVIVEGPMDALAVTLAGYHAICMGGTGGQDQLLDAMTAKRYKGTLLLAYDNDKAGQEAAARTGAQLEAAGFVFLPAEGFNADLAADHPDEPKDADEMRRRDPDLLAGVLEVNIKRARDEAVKRRELAHAQAMRDMHVIPAGAALSDLMALKHDVSPVPTGYDDLDKLLEGGLRPGFLSVLGAGSSLGKTTFSLQLADQMAAAGRPVLYASIEQSADELLAKSLTRVMHQLYPNMTTPTANAIRSGQQRKRWTLDTYGAYERAAAWYAETVAPQLHILEPDRRPSVLTIRAAAERIAERAGASPLVIIDYLQLLAAADDRWDERKATDANITALRQMARETKAMVFVISALNRAGYYGDISMDSFKESGGIEYGADLALGLQPEAMSEAVEGAGSEDKQRAAGRKIIKRTKHQAERRITVRVLKNRSGRTETEAVFVHDAPHETFKPAT